MKHVFEKVRFGNMELKNRLIRSATWEGIAAPDGSISDETYAVYEELAKGGVGAVITGFTSVALHDYYFGGMMRLCDDALIPQYKKLTDLIHAEDVPVITQLALGAYYREKKGRYAETDPDEMTEEEISLVIRRFIEAAVRAEEKRTADTVMIAITGIHGNFYSNPFYYNIGETLNNGGIDFIYAQTNDAFGRIRTVNVNTGKEETIGSWNERFEYTDEDIEAYLDFAEEEGYEHIILAGHSLGANKVIYYLSRHKEPRVEHFFLLSPANLSYMMSEVTEQEKKLIKTQVERGGRRPFEISSEPE